MRSYYCLYGVYAFFENLHESIVATGLLVSILCVSVSTLRYVDTDVSNGLYIVFPAVQIAIVQLVLSININNVLRFIYNVKCWILFSPLVKYCLYMLAVSLLLCSRCYVFWNLSNTKLWFLEIVIDKRCFVCFLCII